MDGLIRQYGFPGLNLIEQDLIRSLVFFIYKTSTNKGGIENEKKKKNSLFS